MATSNKTDLQWIHTKAALLSLTENVLCKICNKLPEDPHLLWCKHSFCKECILNFHQCPDCNYPVKSQDLVRNVMLDHLLAVMRSCSETCSSTKVEDSKKVEDSVITEESKDDYKSPVSQTANIKFKSSKTKDAKERGHSPIKLNIEVDNEKTSCTKEKNRNDIKGKDDKIELKLKSEKTVTKYSNNQNSKQTKVEDQTTSKSTAPKLRKSSISSEKDSVHGSDKKFKNCGSHGSVKTLKNSNSHGYAKTLKNSDGSTKSFENASVKPTKDGSKTPKPKLSPKNLTPKSNILFSAKKIQTSNKVNVKGETQLQIACRLGKLDLVKRLLEEGAEPNVKDYANWTPLCDAVGSGKVEVVKALLEAGAGVNTPSNLNTTALVEAVVRKDKAMVRVLMEWGADMHQRTSLDNTALSLADDDMKRVLTSVTDIPVQPYPRVRSTTRAVLAVKLSPANINQLMNLCQKFNLTLSTTFMEDVSHIVVEKTEANLCHASVAVMLGILNGCTVVSTDWVKACLDKNELLPADEFEPSGTDDYPDSGVFLRARLNKEQLLPRLFDGCHISLQHDQCWPEVHKHDVIALVHASGAVYQPRQCDAERIPSSEQTVMFHAPATSPLAQVSHIILYQPGPSEPLLKYNMAHVKTLSVSWFVECVKRFTLNV